MNEDMNYLRKIADRLYLFIGSQNLIIFIIMETIECKYFKNK